MSSTAINRILYREDPALSFRRGYNQETKAYSRFVAIFRNCRENYEIKLGAEFWIGDYDINEYTALNGIFIKDRLVTEWAEECLEFGRKIRRMHGLPTHKEWLANQIINDDWRYREIETVPYLCDWTKDRLKEESFTTLDDVDRALWCESPWDHRKLDDGITGEPRSRLPALYASSRFKIPATSRIRAPSDELWFFMWNLHFKTYRGIW